MNDATPPDRYPGLTEAIIARYEAEGAAQLMQDYGCPKSEIYERARKLKIRSKNRWRLIADKKKQAAESRKTDVDRAFEKAILERYPTEGTKQIAAEFGVSNDKVASIAYKLEVKSLNHRKHVVDAFIANTDNCNAKSFDLPLSAEGAYFLGLLWADGSIRLQPPVHTVTLTLSETEWHLLESYQQFLGLVGHDHDVRMKNPSHKRQRSISVGNKLLVEQIVARGILQNKSNIDVPHPDCIPDNIYHHWARGWVDGDGSISYGGRQCLKTPRISWCGTKQAVTHLAHKIHELSGAREKQPHLSNKKITDKTWCVGWSNWIDVRRILLWLHQDGGTFAYRKHERPIQQARNT
jgi:hypothetical protein